MDKKMSTRPQVRARLLIPFGTEKRLGKIGVWMWKIGAHILIIINYKQIDFKTFYRSVVFWFLENKIKVAY